MLFKSGISYLLALFGATRGEKCPTWTLRLSSVYRTLKIGIIVVVGIIDIVGGPGGGFGGPGGGFSDNRGSGKPLLLL